PVAFGSLAGYVPDSTGPYVMPFTAVAPIAQPAPVSPVEAKNARPSVAACARAKPLAVCAGPRRPSSAGLSSQRPTEAFTCFAPSGSLAQVWRLVARPQTERSEPK